MKDLAAEKGKKGCEREWERLESEWWENDKREFVMIDLELTMHHGPGQLTG